MPRKPEAPSRMEVLILTALARAPMHGYELKLELRYKHVQWWAKAEHGHLYAALARLERGGYLKQVEREGSRRAQRVYAITPAGRRRLLAAVEAIGLGPDSTYFDVDLFLSACHLMDHGRVIEILRARRAALVEKGEEAAELERTMSAYVPAAGRLIIAHRRQHLAREVEFLDTCIEALSTEATWGSFLRGQRIEEFVARTGVALEGEGAAATPRRASRRSGARRARRRSPAGARAMARPARRPRRRPPRRAAR